MLPTIANALLEVYQDEGIEEAKTLLEKIGKDIKWDFESNETVISGGYPVDITDKKEITKQWIKKVFETAKNKYVTYIINESSPAFGFPLKNYIGNLKMPDNLILAEMEKEITEMMLVFPYISDVLDVFILKVKEKLIIFYTVVTVDDELLSSEAME